MWRDLESITLSKTSQRQILHVITSLWTLKNKREINSQLEKKKLVVISKEKEAGRGDTGRRVREMNYPI